MFLSVVFILQVLVWYIDIDIAFFSSPFVLQSILTSL